MTMVFPYMIERSALTPSGSRRPNSGHSTCRNALRIAVTPIMLDVPGNDDNGRTNFQDMEKGMNLIKKQARAAGLLYFLVLVIAPIGLMYIPGQLYVRGNATATADHIRASESLLRIGISSELVHEVIWVFVVLALYRLFKPVNETYARQMLILGALVSVPIVFINVLNEIAAMMLVSGADFLGVFDRRQLDALAFLFFRLHGQGLNVASIFWGVWLLPFGMLVIKSGFIPRLLGFLLVIAGLGYLASSFTTLLLPKYESLVDSIAGVLEFGELPIILWLIIWGARTPKSQTAMIPAMGDAASDDRSA
jgi:hypothetical protein